MMSNVIQDPVLMCAALKDVAPMQNAQDIRIVLLAHVHRVTLVIRELHVTQVSRAGKGIILDWPAGLVLCMNFILHEFGFCFLILKCLQVPYLFSCTC